MGGGYVQAVQHYCLLGLVPSTIRVYIQGRIMEVDELEHIDDEKHLLPRNLQLWGQSLSSE